MQLLKDDRKLEFLRVHLPYEYTQLRHCLFYLDKNIAQEQWNAFYVASFVHLRNLHEFLSSKSDSNAVYARHFVKNWKRGNHGSGSTIKALNEQVTHLSAKRNLNSKISLEKIKRAAIEVTGSFERFIDKLDDSSKAIWNNAFQPEISIDIPRSTADHISII